MSFLALFFLVVALALVVDMFATRASIPLMPSDALAGQRSVGKPTVQN